MDSDNIIQSTREMIGLTGNTTDFNAEIIMHINSALGILNQNGIGIKGFVVNDGSTWGDFKDPTQVVGNEMFNQLVPMFVFLKTKILFDPPPPSTVPFYDTEIKESLWRLREKYEEDDYAAPIG